LNLELDKPPHWLSFDVEEYFHVEAARIDRRQWDDFPGRVCPPVRRVLELLAEHQSSATFFVLGALADRERGLLREIVAAGHEVASHSMGHTMITRQTPREFRQDLLDARKLLEDVTGRAVLGYRAPTFSITRSTAWALDVLAEASFAYDSSVFPVRHDRYGVPDAPRDPHLARGPGGGSIIEIPPLTIRLLGVNWPVGGGGYLRLLPVWLVGKALGRARRRGQSGMIYLHPWELDPGQPILPMSRMGRFRHRVNLHRTEAKLCRLLERFRFRSVASCLDQLKAAHLPTYDYGGG